MSVPLPRSRRRDAAGASPRGRDWERFVRGMIAHYGGTCWICGCGGARQCDHVESVADRPDLVWDLRNCRPAHGAPGNPCPSCSAKAGRKVHCNQLRGGYSAERARRIIGKWIAANAGARPGDRERPDPGSGREW